MNQRLEVYRQIRIGRQGIPAHAVALAVDGQYTAVATDAGLIVFDANGERLFSYPPHPWPIHQVAASEDFESIVVATRSGAVTHLKIHKDQKIEDKKERIILNYEEQPLYFVDNDINTLAYALETGLIGLGHYSPALTMLNAEGKVLWERHPNLGNATNGQHWNVALDHPGRLFYIASASGGTNQIVGLNAETGALQGLRAADGRVTQLAILPKEKGVVAVVNDGYSYWLRAYDTTLNDLLWEHEFGEAITAVASDKSENLLVIAKGYQGEISLLEGNTGKILAVANDPLNVLVNGIDMSQANAIRAVTEDGTLVFIRYIKAAPSLF